MAELLGDDEIAERIPPAWEREDDTIVRTFEFDEYLDGVDFAAEVGELAEEEFHHPTITIEYGAVTVEFTSHEEGGITSKDIHMAEAVNDLRT